MTALAIVVVTAISISSAIAQTAPRHSDALELSGRLDAAYAAGDVAGYLRVFGGSHPRLRERMAARLRETFAADSALERNSEICAFHVVGEFGIAQVRSTISCAALDFDIHEDSFVALRMSSERAEAMFQIEVSAAELEKLPLNAAGAPRDTFRCDACNYRFRAATGWLLVPNPRERTGVLESLSFYALDMDVAVHLSINAGLAPIGAAEALFEFVVATSNATPELEAWTPPHYDVGNPAPAKLDGARCTLDRGTEVAALHMATFGPVRYLFVAEGTPADLAQHAEAIERFLAGFELADSQLDPMSLAELALRAHTGGHVDETNCYRNELYSIRYRGLPGWNTKQSASHYLFAIDYEHPDGDAVVRLKGLRPLEGTPNHRRLAAERMVRAAFGRSAGRLEFGEWTTAGGSFAQRCTAEVQELGAAFHLVHLALDEDLLVLIEAEGPTVEPAPTIRASFGELVRTR